MGLYLYRSFIRPANSLIVSELLVYGLSAGEMWPFAGRKATNGTAICRKLSWGAPKQPNMVLSICLFIVGLLFPVQKYRCTATIHVAEKIIFFSRDIFCLQAENTHSKIAIPSITVNKKGTNRQDRLWLAPFPKSLLPPQSVESLPPCRFSILINNRPMAVQTSSRTRTISATKMPAPAERASPAVDMIKPPSRPPSCNGRKNNRLANRLVNASINIHCVNVTSIPGRTKRMNIISSAEQTRQASSSSTAETNVLGFWLCKAAIWRSIVSSCSLCLSIKPRAQRFSPGMWRTMFISLTAMPLRYPLRKNHTPRAQNAPAEARIKSMAKLSRSVIRYIKMESSQKIKWLKICVIAYRMTDDEARSVPIFGDNAIIR